MLTVETLLPVDCVTCDDLSDAIAQIAAQARFVFERSVSPSDCAELDNEWHKLPACGSATQAGSLCHISDERMERWCHVVAKGDQDLFEKRLRWDGWNIETVRSLLQPQIPGSEPLPEWAETLRAIVQAARLDIDDNDEDVGVPLFDPAHPLPFEEVWWPAVRVARQRLSERLGPKLPSSVSVAAFRQLELGLRRRLTNLCARTLDEEFSKARPVGTTLINRLVSNEADSTRHDYRYFVQSLRHDGLLNFFQTYPVLGRFMATVVDDGVDAIVEFFQRLEADLPLIESQWSTQQAIGAVAEVQPLLSDVHHHGRSVMTLTFESGLKLVYKPRDLGIEVAFGEFQRWCNKKDPSLGLRALTMLPRIGYGWVEFIEHLPCVNASAAHRFYQRSGMLLSLLYALEGTDCHNENLIACGENLVLVDAEAILHPHARLMTDAGSSDSESDCELDDNTFDFFNDSVLRTGLLPHWNIEAGSDTPYDVSGLGGNDVQQLPRSRLRWQAINTDRMQLIHESIVPPVASNVPMLDGQPLSPGNYVDDLVIGFQKMMQVLIDHRDELLSPSSILSSFQGQRSRFIFRRTQVYGSVLFNGLSPKVLCDGIDFSIEIDRLSRAYLFADEKPKAWSILRAERTAIERLDFPYFSVSTQSDGLSDSLDAPLVRYFERSGYQQVLRRLNQLSDHDTARQISLIRGTFYASTARPFTSRPPFPGGPGLGEEKESGSELRADLLLEAAAAIAETIQRNAIRESDGSIDWIGLSRIPRTERFQYQPLGFNLYDGKSGIALFLAALDAVRGTHQYRELILCSLQPLRRELAQDRKALRRWVQQNQHGAASGLGSILYAWVKLSRFLSAPSLLDEANRLVAEMTDDWIVADHHLDVISGAAGTLLGILAVHRETKDASILQNAIACGQHLLDQRISVDGAPRAWITLERKPLTGFSHGAAGIAYALLQLYDVTHDEAYREAANEAIAYERTAFSCSESNWIDFRGCDVRCGDPGFTMSWCHGAPGIALARLGGLSMLSTHELEHEIDLGLEKTRSTPFQSVDFPCCGNLGLAEVLLVASKKLNRPSLRAATNRRVSMTLEQARQTGQYQLVHGMQTNDYSLGFFQGISGIGYGFLRFAFADKLPSVLLWE